MSNLVRNPNCCFSYAKAKISSVDTVSKFGDVIIGQNRLHVAGGFGL